MSVVLGKHGKAIESLLGVQMDRLTKHPSLVNALLEITVERPGIIEEDLVVEAASRFKSISEVANAISDMADVILKYSQNNKVPTPPDYDYRLFAALLLAIKVRDFCNEQGLIRYGPISVWVEHHQNDYDRPGNPKSARTKKES